MKQSFHKKHNKKSEKGEGEGSSDQTQDRGQRVNEGLHRASLHTGGRSSPRESPPHTEGRSLPRESPPHTEDRSLPRKSPPHTEDNSLLRKSPPHTGDNSLPRKSPPDTKGKSLLRNSRPHTEGRKFPRKSPPTEAAASHEDFLHSEIGGDFPLPQQHTEDGDLSGASLIAPERGTLYRELAHSEAPEEEGLYREFAQSEAPEGLYREFTQSEALYREFAQLEDRDLSIAAIQSDLQQSLLPLVKQELWYKIRYKRLSEGKEEFVPDDPKPPQQYELTEDERYKIEQRRLQNRQSAQRSRKRSENNEQSLLQKISRLEKDNSKLLEEKEKLQKTKESILLKFNNIGCYPSIRICSCGIRLKSGQDVSATETRGSGERDNGVTQQKRP
ncbi:uncharacterized protein LOC128164720 [Crassostrea angulata]|uniref:uncharacterized protein LOC128164720 n=1 Tax=Magallana angulata TaxID=2784310 RepID=UPI0022B1EC6F|nr:uncharacterized protein LOC128164720 [Crassostrea angulata]